MMKLSTSGGSINLNNLSGNIQASTSGGSKREGVGWPFGAVKAAARVDPDVFEEGTQEITFPPLPVTEIRLALCSSFGVARDCCVGEWLD